MSEEKRWEIDSYLDWIELYEEILRLKLTKKFVCEDEIYFGNNKKYYVLCERLLHLIAVGNPETKEKLNKLDGENISPLTIIPQIYEYTKKINDEMYKYMEDLVNKYKMERWWGK